MDFFNFVVSGFVLHLQLLKNTVDLICIVKGAQKLLTSCILEETP